MGDVNAMLKIFGDHLWEHLSKLPIVLTNCCKFFLLLFVSNCFGSRRNSKISLAVL